MWIVRVEQRVNRSSSVALDEICYIYFISLDAMF